MYNTEIHYEGKKSRRKIGKEKISLYEATVTLEQFREMHKKHSLPLAIVLTEEEVNKINDNNMALIEEEQSDEAISYLLKNYYRAPLTNNDSSNTYMYLDSEKLLQAFYDDKIYIDKLIDKDENIKKVEGMYYTDLNVYPIGLGIISNKRFSLVKSYNNLKIVFIQLMSKNVVQEYMKEQRKNTVLTQEQIDKIHAKGLLTIEEVVKQWESWDLCVPNSSDRCKKFRNCHECLVDYASYKQGHQSLLKNLVPVKYIDEDDFFEPMLVKKK